MLLKIELYSFICSAVVAIERINFSKMSTQIHMVVKVPQMVRREKESRKRENFYISHWITQYFESILNVKMSKKKQKKLNSEQTKVEQQQ